MIPMMVTRHYIPRLSLSIADVEESLSRDRLDPDLRHERGWRETVNFNGLGFRGVGFKFLEFRAPLYRSLKN